MKALNFLVSIGGKDISHKAVKSFEMDRNFSDIANPFSLTFIDHPSVALTDLELYMAQGYRSCAFSYSDGEKPGEYQKFKGQIIDYDCTFVGDMKQLTVSGYASRVVGGDISGSYKYNIDWNSYYNRRQDETDTWNCLSSYLYKAEQLLIWQEKSKDSDDPYFLNSATSNSKFLASYNKNSVMVQLKGPKGTIKIPVPDSFTTMIPHVYKTDPETGEETDEDIGDIMDPDNRFWGKLKEETLADVLEDRFNSVNWCPIPGYDYDFLKESAKLTKVYIQEKDGKKYIRGFSLDDGQNNYIQLNPEKQYYGAGQLIYSQTGVDISYIVKQFAILEGWEIGNIVQTELVPCSDKFKMQNQTAVQFIQEVLVPMAITPVGEYFGTDGEPIQVDRGYGGFMLYFRENKVYFEPIYSKLQRNLIDIALGYNIKNSPVLSFKVNTKGTAFYTNPVSKMNSMSVVTGVPTDEVVVSDGSAVTNYNRVKGHNASLDAYFGYTYEQIKDMFGSKTSSTGWIGLDSAINLGNYLYESDLVQKGLVKNIPSSAENSSMETFASISDIRAKIENFVIQASMTLWARAELSPNSIISITNMVKSSNSDIAEKHPTSGKYLILKQKDSFSDGQYIQQLSLIRSDGVVINPEKIDWSKSFKAIKDTVTDESKNTAIGSLYPNNKSEYQPPASKPNPFPSLPPYTPGSKPSNNLPQLRPPGLNNPFYGSPNTQYPNGLNNNLTKSRPWETNK